MFYLDQSVLGKKCMCQNLEQLKALMMVQAWLHCIQTKQLQTNCIPWLVFTAIAQNRNSLDSSVLIDQSA